MNNFNNQFGYSLVPIYIPNEGYRYFVVVPADKWNFLNTNLINGDRNSLKQQKYDKYDKINGRYNAKLKKYKAYEKFLKPQHEVSHHSVWSSQKPKVITWEVNSLLLHKYLHFHWTISHFCYVSRWAMKSSTIYSAKRTDMWEKEKERNGEKSHILLAHYQCTRNAVFLFALSLSSFNLGGWFIGRVISLSH